MSCPLLLSSHLSEEYASLYVCMYVSVCERVSLYIHVLLYESVVVCACVFHGRPLNCKGKSRR